MNTSHYAAFVDSDMAMPAEQDESLQFTSPGTFISE